MPKLKAVGRQGELGEPPTDILGQVVAPCTLRPSLDIIWTVDQPRSSSEAVAQARSSDRELMACVPLVAPSGLGVALGMPPAWFPSNPGSALHGVGGCQPCAWFWKPGGCQNEQRCFRCHLCPDGALKARRQFKTQIMRSFPTAFPSQQRSLSSVRRGGGKEEPAPTLLSANIAVNDNADDTASARQPSSSFVDLNASKPDQMDAPFLSTMSSVTTASSVASATSGVGDEMGHSDTSSSRSLTDHNASINTRDKSTSLDESTKGDGNDEETLLGLHKEGGVARVSHIDELPSAGSELHFKRECEPCAWHWKFGGCQHGSLCNRCHLCPEGELKSRRKAKISAMRSLATATETNDAANDCFPAQMCSFTHAE